MCVFIDFARLAAALRCCRNVVSIGRQGMLRFAVGMAVFLAAACLVAQEAAAQVSDAEIARAVRTVRNTEGLGLMRPSISAAVTITDDVRSRVDNALSLLGRRGSGDPDLIARIGDEFVRQDALEKLFGFKFGVGAAITSNRRNKAIKDATSTPKESSALRGRMIPRSAMCSRRTTSSRPIAPSSTSRPAAGESDRSSPFRAATRRRCPGWALVS